MPLKAGLAGEGGRGAAELFIMMNQTDSWMHGGAGGGLWLWTVLGLVIVTLLVVAIMKLSRK